MTYVANLAYQIRATDLELSELSILVVIASGRSHGCSVEVQ